MTNLGGIDCLYLSNSEEMNFAFAGNADGKATAEGRQQ